MPPLAFKSDASFFEKIALGAIGAQAVAEYLNARGHRMAELENGSTATKMWKDVKRKRVRIPDLICIQCGQRVESRAKSKAKLAMSHSTSDAERAWDYGMVDEDWIAFPILQKDEGLKWSAGRLQDDISYWHIRERTRWLAREHISFLQVAAFRRTAHVRSATKGATEGSETAIAWDASFSKRRSKVIEIDKQGRVFVEGKGGRRQTLPNRKRLDAAVRSGDVVAEDRLLVSAVAPLWEEQLVCRGNMPAGHIADLLASRERTLRFTGVKLARLRQDLEHRELIARLGADPVEDLYVRMEASAYRVRVGAEPADATFQAYLEHAEDQVRLEAVVALAETRSDAAGAALAHLLDNPDAPYFLRSAAAWGLGRIGTADAAARLIAAFPDVDVAIREEALEALTLLGMGPVEQLVRGLFSGDDQVAAGAAEAIRRLPEVREAEIQEIVGRIVAGERPDWATWVLGSLPDNDLRGHPEVASLELSRPEVYFATSVLASFVASWISRSWEAFPRPQDFKPTKTTP